MTASDIGAHPQTLVEFLETCARQSGEAPALLYKPGLRYERWSYNRLLDGARRAAGLIRAHGLSEGDRVLICGPNCPQWVVAYFGCAFAGAVMVPLDIRSAPDFAARVAGRTEPRLAFLSRRNPETFESLCPSTIYFEEVDGILEDQPPAEPLPRSGEDLLEIMFTSGTTGDPKGVMLTHANLMANLAGARHHVPGDPSYRLLSLLPLSHMLEQMSGLLLPMSCGASVTYPTSLQPSALAKAMRERQITLMVAVPQVLTLFMNGIEREVERRGRRRLWDLLLRIATKLPFRWRRLLFGSVHKRFGGKLAVFFTGGAPLDPEIGRKWEAIGVHIIQGYGATEASPVISSHTIKEPRYDSVGRPLPGTSVRIDPEGEIQIRGANITQGYWQAPEQTAAAFIDGWFRTGDLGLIDEAGFLHIRGRKKDMIPLASGQKVFPEDVETVLTKHLAILDAVVVGLPRQNGPEVHAVLLTRDQTPPAEVIAWANRQLAEHQQIRGFTLWPEGDFPRTHTLKVRKNLVLDRLMGKAPAEPTVPAAGPTASEADRLTRLLAQLSGLEADQIRPAMTLGGDLNLDSLKRVELLSLIEEEIGVSLDDTQVDGETKVADLAVLADAEPQPSAVPAFRRWSRSWWCRPIRALLQAGLILPLVRRLYRVEVNGLEVLSQVQAPAIFVCNHNLSLDNAVLIQALPKAWRRRLAIAAAADLWRNPLFAVMNPLLGNAFPFSREGSIRPSLENLVRVLDEGWNVLIYPEGVLTIGGPIQPFKAGIGLLAVGARVPIVPLRLSVDSTGQPANVPWRRPGYLRIDFGRPLLFDVDDAYVEATARIEDAVHALGVVPA